MIGRRFFSLLIAAVAACSSDRAQTVTLAPPASVVATPPTPTPTQTPPVQTVATHRNACVMLYECGCNAGCTQIDQQVDDLKPGMKVGVRSGPLAGSSVFVAQNHTADGASVFTVQRADPKAPIQVCANERSPLVGYGCEVKNSGAARACTTCE